MCACSYPRMDDTLPYHLKSTNMKRSNLSDLKMYGTILDCFSFLNGQNRGFWPLSGCTHFSTLTLVNHRACLSSLPFGSFHCCSLHLFTDSHKLYLQSSFLAPASKTLYIAAPPLNFGANFQSIDSSVRNNTLESVYEIFSYILSLFYKKCLRYDWSRCFEKQALYGNIMVSGFKGCFQICHLGSIHKA